MLQPVMNENPRHQQEYFHEEVVQIKERLKVTFLCMKCLWLSIFNKRILILVGNMNTSSLLMMSLCVNYKP